MTTLFDPLRIGRIEAKNRLVMAPMTRLRAEGDGTPTELMRQYYTQRAGAGLIVTEGTYLDPASIAYVNQPGIETEAHIAGWKRITDSVHDAGGRIVLQAHHAGRITHPDLLGGGDPVAPSAVKPEGEVHTRHGKKAYVSPRALELEEIPAIIDGFATATGRALSAGFDGVELHAANGYLPHTFLSNRTNLRTDGYGGSIENRARFVIEVLEAMVGVAGPGRIGVKLTVGPFPAHDIATDDEEELYPYLARALDSLGLAYIHVQQPITNWGIPDVPFDPLTLFRPYLRGTLIAGGALDRAKADAIVSSGRADAVSFGRAYLANPDLAERLKTGAALNEADPATFYTPGPHGYVDYPTLTQSR